MAIHCPNCGHESDDHNAKFCEYCGARLPRPFENDDVNNSYNSSDYEFDFDYNNGYSQSGYSQNQNPYQSDYKQPYAPFAQDVKQDPNCIRTKDEPIMLNKWNKQNFGWTVFMLIVGVFMMISLSSLSSILKGEQIDGYLLNVQEYPWNVVSILSIVESGCVVLFFVAAVGMIVFTSKMKSVKFPTTDESVFYKAKRLQLLSLFALLTIIVYTAISLADNIISIKYYIDIFMNDGNINVSTFASGFLFNILLIVGCSVCAKNSKKIATTVQR